ncbi:uncharacterized protein [Triticum aestivum]|uniref:uncharacterized protein isoform X2 n=1 Tax=Triticum aestivum TaxID=4565 RepID=UPI001D034774|nr:uncharacterized protein LOC123090671 isoform X2 [Triticum aestivum]
MATPWPGVIWRTCGRWCTVWAAATCAVPVLHRHLVHPSHRSKAGDAEMIDGEMALLELAKASGTKSGPFLSVGGNLAASSRLGSFLSREVASRGREEAEETLGKSSILAERCPHPIPLSFSVCFSMDNIATDRSTIQALGRRILMLACPLKDCRIPTLVSNMVYTDDDVTLVDVPCSLLQEQRRRNIQFSMWI